MRFPFTTNWQALFTPKKAVEEEQDEPRRITPSRRRFENDNSAKPIKPKLPPRPWGRKERLLIGGILLATILIALGSFLSSRGFSFSLSVFESLLPSETVTFEKER